MKVKDEVAWIYNALKIDPYKTVDLGCGGEPKAVFGVDIQEHSSWRQLTGQGFMLREADMRRLPLADESFEAAISWHSLEHVGWREAAKTLKEWRRVLKPGGVLVVCVPNMETLPRWFVSSGEDVFQAIQGVKAIYGGQGDSYDYHRVGFNYAVLKALLTVSGYTEVERLYNPSLDNLVVKAVKGEGSPSIQRARLSPLDPRIEVSIVIPTVNTPTLRGVVEELIRNTPQIYELVFVADNPDEETLSILREYGDQSVVNDRLVGMPVAYNQGIALARGRYIAFVLSDIYVSMQWLPALLIALKRHPEYGWVAPTWISDDGKSGRFATCSCCVFTREALGDVGFFDEEFSSPDAFGFEDDDLYLRFLLNGYEPHGVLNSYVKHPKSGTTLSAVHGEVKGERFIRNQLKLYRKWGVTGTDWNAVPYTFLEDFVDRFNFVLQRANGRVLDIGCKESPTFGKREEVVRVDLDVWRHPFFVRADAHSLPFRADAFNTAVLGEVLEHVEDPVGVLEESLRVAEKTVFTTPAEEEWLEAEKSHDQDKTACQALEEQVYPFKDRGLVTVLDEERHRHHRHRWFWKSDAELEDLLQRVSNNYVYAKYVYPAYYGGVVHRRTMYGRGMWIQNNSTGLVLDIACHDGKISSPLPCVVGLDLVSDLPKDQQDHIKESWRGKPFIIGDANHLPIREKAFDTAIASEVLEHVWTPISLLREAVRVSRDRVLLTVPDEWNWDPVQKPFTHPQHLHYYTTHTFKDLLGQVGDVAELDQFINDRPDGFSFFYALLKPKTAIKYSGEVDG